MVAGTEEFWRNLYNRARAVVDTNPALLVAPSRVFVLAGRASPLRKCSYCGGSSRCSNGNCERCGAPMEID